MGSAECGQKIRNGGRTIPDRNDEYFLYQTLVGSVPFAEEEFAAFVDRAKAYIIKAVREAKVRTAWLRPDSDYENGYIEFVDALLATPEANDFLTQFRPFQAEIAEYGILNSLAQVLLKYSATGVPDLYQGDEFWNLSMVDPDNRRPVDYQQRSTTLDQIKQALSQDALALMEKLWTTRTDGSIKLFLTYQLLQVRKANALLFQQGDYLPLQVEGERREHIIAFARTFEGGMAIAIAPRFFTRLVQPGVAPLGTGTWNDTAILLPETAPSHWINAITGQTVQRQTSLFVAEMLEHFPAALLVSQ